MNGAFLKIENEANGDRNPCRRFMCETRNFIKKFPCFCFKYRRQMVLHCLKFQIAQTNEKKSKFTHISTFIQFRCGNAKNGCILKLHSYFEQQYSLRQENALYRRYLELQKRIVVKKIPHFSHTSIITPLTVIVCLLLKVRFSTPCILYYIGRKYIFLTKRTIRTMKVPANRQCSYFV